MPVLNIVDAIYINPQTKRGKMVPSTSYKDAYNAKKVIASTDLVAIDYWVSGNILYPVMKKLGISIPSKSNRDSLEPVILDIIYAYLFWKCRKVDGFL